MIADLALADVAVSLAQQRDESVSQNKILRARYIVWLEAGGDLIEAKRRKVADALQCSRDFLYWLRWWGWVQDPQCDVPELRDAPFVPWPSQVDLSLWLDERTAAGEMALIPKSRKIGATWLALHKLYWGWRFRAESSLVGSRTEQLVDLRGVMGSLLEKVRYIHRRQPTHLRERRVQDMHLVFKNLRNQASITGQATSFDFGRGDRQKIVLLDEFAAVPERVATATIRGVNSVASSTWILYNPGLKTHKSYALYQSLAPRMVRAMDWRSDPFRPADFIERQIFPRGSMTRAEAAREYECVHGAVVSGEIWTFQSDVLVYDDLTPEWARNADLARAAWFAPGGWDFGSGASLLVCLFAVVEWSADRRRFEVWIDDELSWSQTGWSQAATDAVDKLRNYGGPRLHYGDPAGVQRESNQQSWESNLKGGGIPLWCLPAPVNASEVMELEIKAIQHLINSGLVHVHRRCALLLESMRSWRRNLPEFMTVDMATRAYVAPRHDAASHACKALLYLIAGIKLQQQHELREVDSHDVIEGNFTGVGSTANMRALMEFGIDEED